MRQIVSPVPGITLQGFLVGYNEEYILLRTAQVDLLVPRVRMLERLIPLMSSPRNPHAFVQIQFDNKASLPRGYSLWEGRLAIGYGPEGLRGTLRRAGRRLVPGANMMKGRPSGEGA